MPADHGFLIVGIVAKPHGIKGELYLKLETDHPDAVFAPGKVLLLGDAQGRPSGGQLTVERARPFKGGMLVKSGEFSRLDPSVEALRGRTLLMAAGDAQPLDADEAFLHDLPGMKVVSGGEALGVVSDVYELPAGWYLVVKRDGRRELLIPFVREMVRGMDRAAGTVEVALPEGFTEL
jgi:16S rRNA processing protein RimM